MDETVFLKGQRVITPDGEGEIVDSVGNKFEVKLDSGQKKHFLAEELTDNSDAG